MENRSSDLNRKLVDISTQYSKFNVNQLLTEKQLNGFLDYFDDQDRLTRTSLSGVGIVCGFQVKYDSDKSTIEITQGRGVTTDGDLVALQKPSETEDGKNDNTIKSIQLPSQTFKFFKKFSDDEANYDHFIDADDKQIDLWELYETNPVNNPRISLSSFPNEEASPSLDEEEETLKLSDMVVLLYLESYSKDDDLCSQLTCDSQGIEQVSRLRVLLVSKTDAEYIVSKDGIYDKHDWYQTFTSLPEVSAKRVVLNTRNTKTFKRLKQNYYNVIKNNNTNDNDVLDRLIEGLDLILKKFEIENTISPLIKRVFNFTELRIPIDFQYRYDVLKDFIDTYNEIKEILLHLNIECCPKIGAFPKHLMLGRLVEEKPYATFRHEFYKSPIISCEDDNYKKVLSLFVRLKELSDGYNYLNKAQEIKITPSQALDKLSNKAVPYYYNVSDSVLKHWNFEKNQSLKHRFNLSYHTKNLVNVPSIQQPLDHNLDHFNFYRIEGHQGKVYQEALADVLKIKKDKGLNFDVKVLSIETDNKNIELKNYKCQFEDLEILLNAWKAEQECVLGEVSSFMSSFSTENAGKNVLSEKKGYNSISEKRKEREIEKEKEKVAVYKEELKKLKEEKMSNEEVDKVKKYEETIKKLFNNGEREEAEVLAEEYKAYLKKIEEAKLTEDEANKIKEYEESLKELSNSGDKLDEITKKEEYEAYLKKLEEAKMSDEEIAKRKEYEASLKKIEEAERNKATAFIPARYDELAGPTVPRKEEYESYSTDLESPARVTYTDAAGGDMIHYDTYTESVEKVEMTEEEIAKKKKYDEMWQKMGYTETTAAVPVSVPHKSTYNDIWDKVRAVNIKEASEIERIKQKNSVKEGLSKEDSTVGKLFYQILEENPKASKNEILALVKEKMLEASKQESWKENEEMKKFILEDTTGVLVNAYALDDEIPNRIEDINEEGLTRYKVTIGELCERVRQLQSSYDSLDLDSGTKQITGLLINQLSTVCCSGKKLEILYEEIQKRKDNILVQTKLSEFVKNHPGLEHKAGVKPGGTFVMVYLKEAKEEKAIYESTVLEIRFLKQPEVKEEGLEGESGVIQLWKDEYKLPFTFVNKNAEEDITTNDETTAKYEREYITIGETIADTVSNFAKYLNTMFSIAGLSDEVIAATRENALIIGIVDNYIQEKTNFIQFENAETTGTAEPIFFNPNRVVASSVTAKNTVIADFALPYMCCSDCTPVNFIVPKIPVELSLPEKHVCLKEGETIDPMPFTVLPVNGEVAAMVPDGVQSGLIFDEFGRAFFDGSLTDPSLHGKEIGFTVDDDLTDCTIIVYADVPLSIETNVSYNTLKTLATVTYKVSNIYPNLTYNWDFGNGIFSNQAPNANGIIAIMYQLPVENDNTIKPSLLVSNGVCEKQVLIDPITFDDIVEVSLNIIDSYCLDRNSTDKVLIPFTKNPQDITVKIIDESIEGLLIENDQLIIIPELFKKFDEPIQFSMGGMPTDAKITINAAVEIEIIAQESDYSWSGTTLYRTYNLTMGAAENANEEQITRKWEIDGVEKGTEKDLSHKFLIDKEGSSYEITAHVKDENGCTSSKKITLSIPYPEFEMKMPENQKEFCLNDETAYPVSVNPQIPKTPYSGAGISLNDGQLIFIPKKTKLTKPTSVQFKIAGKTAISLKLKAVPKAKFEWEITDEMFIVKNTSEIAEKYTFRIGEYEFDRVNRNTLKKSIYEFRDAIIDVSITTSSPCGNDTFQIEGIKLREEDPIPTNCEEDTSNNIKNDSEIVFSDVDLQEDLIEAVIKPTKELYENALESLPFVLNSGLPNYLDYFGSLLPSTAEQIDKYREKEYERDILSKFFIVQVKLFFNLIHCQPHEILMQGGEEVIMKVIDELEISLKNLRSLQIQFDNDNKLKDFLKQYSDDPMVIEYVTKEIKERLIPVIL